MPLFLFTIETKLFIFKMITEVLLGALLFLACHIFYTIYCLHTIVYLYYANKYYANKERSGTTN